MSRMITESVVDADIHPLSFYRAGDSTFHANRSYVVTRSDGKTYTEEADMSLAELVAAGAITSGERTTLLSLLAKVNAGLKPTGL